MWGVGAVVGYSAHNHHVQAAFLAGEHVFHLAAFCRTSDFMKIRTMSENNCSCADFNAQLLFLDQTKTVAAGCQLYLGVGNVECKPEKP